MAGAKRTTAKRDGAERSGTKRTGGRKKPLADEVESDAALPVATLPAPAAEACAEFMRRRVAEELPAICESLLKKARDGDATVLKTLWQLAGLAKVAEEASNTVGDAGGRGEVYARETLRRLRCTGSGGSAASEPGED